MGVTWACRSALGSVSESRVRTRSHFPQSCCRFGAEDRQPRQSRTMHSVTLRGCGLPWSLLFPVQSPRHAASSGGRAGPERVSCIVSALPSAPPNTAVGAHWRLPRPSPTLGDHNPFPHYTEQELLQGVVLGLTQGTKSGRSLHNCVCSPIEEHFPGAHLRGVATRSTCIITRRWASAASCPCPSPVTHHRREIAAAATHRAPSLVW